MCTINCSGGCRDCAPEEHLEAAEEILGWLYKNVLTDSQLDITIPKTWGSGTGTDTLRWLLSDYKDSYNE